jgi:hypothetical protein
MVAPRVIPEKGIVPLGMGARIMDIRNMLVGGAVAALLVLAGHAQAAACKVTQSVVNSAASLQANATAGGHVSIHIQGQPTEAGKSQFTGWTAFNGAFTTWSNHTGPKGPTPKTCGGGSAGVMDCVDASLVNITAGIRCDAVDRAGHCTQETPIAPVKVAFRYAKSKGVWIINTSYPSENSSCQ